MTIKKKKDRESITEPWAEMGLGFYHVSYFYINTLIHAISRTLHLFLISLLQKLPFFSISSSPQIQFPIEFHHPKHFFLIYWRLFDGGMLMVAVIIKVIPRTECLIGMTDSYYTHRIWATILPPNLLTFCVVCIFLWLCL